MIYLIGAGGHGLVVGEIFLFCGRELRIADSDPTKFGASILERAVESEEVLLHSLSSAVDFFVAIGNPELRRQVTERWLNSNHRLTRAVHPSAVVSPSAQLKEGVCIMAGTVLQAASQVGRGAIVNTGATVDHHCRLEDYVHVAPGVHLAGDVHVGEGAWVGVGSAVREGLSIGAWTMVGAGSVVTEDVPSGVVAYGNPCRVVRGPGKCGVRSAECGVEEIAETEVRGLRPKAHSR